MGESSRWGLPMQPCAGTGPDSISVLVLAPKLAQTVQLDRVTSRHRHGSMPPTPKTAAMHSPYSAELPHWGGYEPHLQPPPFPLSEIFPHNRLTPTAVGPHPVGLWRISSSS